MLNISSGRYFAIFCVNLIMPAALVIICTKYGLGKRHSTTFKNVYITSLFRTVRNRFYVVYHSLLTTHCCSKTFFYLNRVRYNIRKTYFFKNHLLCLLFDGFLDFYHHSSMWPKSGSKILGMK